jgi:hypothetical protein
MQGSARMELRHDRGLPLLRRGNEMTAREQEHIRMMRNRIAAEQFNQCYICLKSLPFSFQLAHRIPQRKWTVAKWGKEVIHHRDNLRGVCSLYCNGRVEINPESIEAATLAAKIAQKVARNKS